MESVAESKGARTLTVIESGCAFNIGEQGRGLAVVHWGGGQYGGRSIPKEEARAMADLFAAAPDLAEACRMAEHAMTGPRGEVYNRNTIDAITRALGKAGVL